MPASSTPEGVTFILKILTSAFLGILFLQSGIDKVMDRRGNLEWLTGHFSKTMLAKAVPFLLTLLTILELAAGALSALGCVLVMLARSSTIAFYGAVVAAVAMVALFLGQRLAKDYPGAAALVPYFVLTLIAIYVLA